MTILEYEQHKQKCDNLIKEFKSLKSKDIANDIGTVFLNIANLGGTIATLCSDADIPPVIGLLPAVAAIANVYIYGRSSRLPRRPRSAATIPAPAAAARSTRTAVWIRI